MMRGVTDSRDREIALGARVAYNRSGNVIEGIVVGMAGSVILIEPDLDYQRPGWPTISRVKNWRSVLVIG